MLNKVALDENKNVIPLNVRRKFPLLFIVIIPCSIIKNIAKPIIPIIIKKLKPKKS